MLPIENAIKPRSCVRFWLILHVKNNFFSKNAQNQRAKLIFSKKAKILLFNFGLFQQVLLTWNDNLAKEARRLKSKIEFEDWYRRWRNSWTSWCSNEDRISRLAKALKWKIYHLLFGFSAQASTLGVFKTRFRPWIHQPSNL